MLYVTHGALCALFMQRYQKLEMTGKNGVKVGETKSERVVHVEFMKKMLSEGGEPSEQMVKIVSVHVVILNQHTIKNKQIITGLACM